MAIKFTNEDIEQISASLGCSPQKIDDAYSWKLSDKASGQSLMFYVYEALELPNGEIMSSVSVQTKQGFFELHNCTHFMVFEPDELIFISLNDSTVSCLTIGRNATCSVYSDISRQLLNADITTINSNLLLSSMQLALLENVLIPG